MMYSYSGEVKVWQQSPDGKLAPANGVQPLNTGGVVCSITATKDINNKPIIVCGCDKGTVKMYEMAPGWNRRGLWYPHSISKQTACEVWSTASSAKNHAFFTGGTDGSAVCFMFQQQQQQQQQNGFNAVGSPQSGQMGGVQMGSPQMGGNQQFNALQVGQAANVLAGMSQMGNMGNNMGNMGGLQTPAAPQMNGNNWGSPAPGGMAAPNNMFQTGGQVQNNNTGGNMWGTPGGQKWG